MGHGVTIGKVFYKHELEKDRLRMGGGSWSINLDVVDLNKVHTVVFNTEKGRYTIPSSVALTHGFERTLGGEKKLVVPVKHWEFDEPVR